MAGAVKIGSWGLPSGKLCDINSYSSPQRLISITVYSNETPGGCIASFSFTYVDQTGGAINVGTLGNTWGRRQNVGWMPQQSSELLSRMSGTSNSRGVTSLKIVTNQGDHGTYGFPAGDAFSVPLRQGKNEVVAFFGHSGDTLKSLGVYVPGAKECPVKVGPWGGHLGSSRDLYASNMPVQLQSIAVRSSERSGGRVFGFSYNYLDKDGQRISVGPWGSRTKGQQRNISMNEDNYITFISGTYDDYGITSLKFESTQDDYGPFGCPVSTAFSVPVRDTGAIVGFFGRSSADGLVGFGAYVVPLDD